MQNILRKIPDVVSGYPLDKLQFSVIVPVERTNLILNPSFETNTTGYTSVDGAALTRTTELQRRGVFSLRVKPGLAAASGIYYTTTALVSGSTYAFSLDVWIRASRKYRIRAFDGARTLVTKRIVGHSGWQRIEVMFTAVTNGAHRLYLEKDDNTDTENFFTDGWQLELCAAGNFYPTTYIDGDQEGFVVNQNPPAYSWLGIPHASQSIRSGQTRAGGRVMEFNKIGFAILGIIGLGFSPVSNISTRYGSVDGSYYQRTLLNARSFTVAGYIAANGYNELQKKREQLENLINPRITAYNQPLLLRIDTGDCRSDSPEIINIPCLYKSGLEGNTINYYQEKIGIQFDLFDESFSSEGDVATTLNYQANLLNANNIIRRMPNGAWDTAGGGANSFISAIELSPDGVLYAGGDFTTIGGVAANRIARWNGTTWEAIGSGVDSSVLCMTFAADGTLYVGGAFLNAGGSPAVRVARWNGSAWSALGTGAVGGSVRDLDIGTDGTLYMAGAFSSAGGVANTAGIAKWNGSAWSAMGTGPSGGIVLEVEVGMDGTVYAGGDFTLMGGVADTVRIAKWNGTVWSAMGTGGADAQVGAMAIGIDGSLYIGGAFTTLGGTSIFQFARWNGTAWSSLPGGIITGGVPQIIVPDMYGNLYVTGTFTSIGGVTFPDKFARFNGTSWEHIGIDLPGSIALFAIAVDLGGAIWMGYASTGTALVEYVSIVTIEGQSPSKPVIKFTGPGSVYQLLNTTSGLSIYFNLTLQSGEVAMLDLSQGNISFTSNLRGNILGTILPSSDIALFSLLPCTNSISVFISGVVTPTTQVTMMWKNEYNSISSAIR